MLKTNIEFRRGVFFIKFNCNLNKENYKKLKKEIFPLLLKSGFKYVTLNLDEVDVIDSYGINLIDEINDIVLHFNGKTTLIKNKRIEKLINGTIIDTILYRARNEKTALGVFEL